MGKQEQVCVLLPRALASLGGSREQGRAHMVTGSKGTRKYEDTERTTLRPGTRSAFQRDDKVLAHHKTA